MSHFDSSLYSTNDEWKERLQNSPVRIQWDPEKDIHLNNLNYKSLQVGLTGIAIYNYVNDWIVSIKDISPLCHEIHTLLHDKKREDAMSLLPQENLYPLSDDVKKIIGHS